MAVTRTVVSALVLAGGSLIVSAGPLAAVPNGGVLDGARAFERADRSPHRIIDYDVFGDSITAGYGVAAHLTWVAGIQYHLRVTEPPDVEHRFHNHAIDGQAIITPSFLARDPQRSSLVEHLRLFLAAPLRSTPLADRTFVLVPSINELIVSDRGNSGSARVARAVAGMRTAVAMLRVAGVPDARIIVLPMPPIGLQFASDYERDSTVDRPLASMIVGVNAGIADLLDVGRYPRLDPENDGLADASVFDDLVNGGRDGLHLDAYGHSLLAADIEPRFGSD